MYGGTLLLYERCPREKGGLCPTRRHAAGALLLLEAFPFQLGLAGWEKV